MEDDNKTLKDYSIKEGDFIVVMISKVSQHLSLKALKAKPAPKNKPEDVKQEESVPTQAAQNQQQQPPQPTTSAAQ